MDECDSRSLAFYVFMLFVSIIELMMTFQYLRVLLAISEFIKVDSWFMLGIQIEYLVFFIPSKVLQIYCSLKRPIMRAYNKRSRVFISLIQIIYTIAPTEMISFFA